MKECDRLMALPGILRVVKDEIGAESLGQAVFLGIEQAVPVQVREVLATGRENAPGQLGP